MHSVSGKRGGPYTPLELCPDDRRALQRSYDIFFWWAMRRCLFTAVLLASAALRAAAGNESGLPLFQNFAPRDYRAQNQTWASVQDTDGLMYFGNRGCVLRYDGTQWNSLPVPNALFVRGLALGPDRTLYAGGVNQLGYFPPPTADGERSFVSLLDRLPADQREFHEIWSVSILSGGEVCFLTDERLLVWHAGQFTILPVSKNTFGNETSVFTVDDTTGQLRQFQGGHFTPISSEAFFRDTRLIFVLPEADGSLLLGSRDHGLFRFAAGKVSSVPTDIDEFLAREGLRAGRRLHDGSLALSTRQSGVVLLDSHHRLLCRLDQLNGLPSTTARTFTPDREGGLWLSHNNGITRLEWPSALTVLGKRNGLGADLLQDIVRHDGRLYVITNNGAFYLATESAAAPNATFLPVVSAETGEPLRGGFRGLLPTAHGLLLGDEHGLYVVQGDRGKKILDPGEPIMSLSTSPRDPDRVYLGRARGLRQIRFQDGAWTAVGDYPEIQGDVRAAMEGNDGTLWVAVTTQGYYRIPNPAQPALARVEHITGGNGLPDSILGGFTYVMPWRGQPLFAMNSGLFTYDAATGRFARLTAVGPRLEQYNLATQGTDSPDHLWLRTYAREPGAGQWHQRRIWCAGVDGEWRALPYLAADVVDDSRIFREEKDGDRSVLWVPGTEVLLRVDLTADAFHPTPLAPPLLRSPEVRAGEKLPYARNSVVFRHVAPSFRQRAQIEYETQLLGFEAAPRPWSATTETSFTNLPEGDYTFRVRARNSDETVSPPVELAFTILPPWWRTLWAKAGYGLLLAGFVAGLVRWRGAAFRRQNQRLESIVAARTAELRANEEHLRQARDAAEAASRAKSSFLANMSHELRTPLNAILGYARILRQDETLPAAGRQRAGVIDESGTHLLQVINDVLDLSKIEADKLTLQAAPTALPALLEGVVAAFRPLAFEKGLEFNPLFGPDLPAAVTVDGHRLRQVLFNLLGNALKFTPRGRVTFSVVRAGAALRFTVEDTGVGISAEQLRAIFLPFHQAHGSTLTQQGTGLGLTISQRIVELLGGRLEVASVPGTGSRFWFDVVLSVAELPPVEKSRPIVGYTGRRRRLLLVDDEPVNRDVLRGLLQPLGFEIQEAGGGEGCLAIWRDFQPDAILLDLRMPGLDGFETAHRLRAESGDRGLVILAVSASVFEENRQDAINAGCDDFLPKPIQLDRTLAALQKHLGVEWLYAEAPASSPPFFKAPPASVLDELHQLSLSGEVEQLSARLAEIAAASPEYAPFAQALDVLALRFQMKRIREILLAEKNRPS
jgi:signal transduction histidine kinase/CheY-like chemotaxis protein